MRPLRGALALLALASVLAGCGGGSAAGPTTAASSTAPASTAASRFPTAFARSLSALCDTMRHGIEALGQNDLVGTMPRRNRIGLAFVARLKALTPPPGKKTDVDVLRLLYETYWSKQGAAYLLLKRHDFNGYYGYQSNVSHYEKEAETLATQLGAPTCARQPFS